MIALNFSGLILSLSGDISDNSIFNPSYNFVQSVVRLNGGSNNQSSQNIPSPPSALEQTINRREMLRKHFPDWYERVEYQKKQEKIYRSGLARITAAKRARVKLELTKEEQDAFDYFEGKDFYKYHQSLEIPPNIFDTRSSFLLKVEINKDMRKNFLNSYNRRKSEN